VAVFAILFISFFFLKENRMFTEFLSGIVPSQYEKNVVEAINDTTLLLSRYFSGILLQMAFVTFFLSIGLAILGINNAILIAVFAALINIVPYLGPWMGCLFAFSVAITSNLHLDFYTQTVPLLFKIAFIFGLMQFLNDWIVQPLIFSNRVLAHPLEIFLVTLIGAKIGGIPGMVLAIPAYTVLRVIAREFFQRYRFVQKITKGLDESGVV
jgi:predicted PurR-regulated permease PerM